MFDFYLPLAKEFERIFLENDVYEWEAKKIWEKFDKSVRLSNRQRSYMYSGIKTLTILEYLSFKPSAHNHKVFLYTSTQKLKNLCDKREKTNIKGIIEGEKRLLISSLGDCEIQISFISEMFSKHPHLNNELIIINNDLNFEKRKLEKKINAATLLLKK